MPPPYRRRNPVADAEASFFDEPPVPRFFAPVGQGDTALGGYISPRLAGNLQQSYNEIEDSEDARATKREEQFLRRLQSRSGARVLPHTEAANIATARLTRERAESDIKNNPFHEREDAAESQFQTKQAELGLESMPEDEAARREARDIGMERLRSQDPNLERIARMTKNPAHLRAYDYFTEAAPKEIRDPEQRRRFAQNKALQLAEDEDGVDALYEARALNKIDDDAIAEMVESVDSPDGQHFGLRIKPEARAKVRSLLAESKMRKLTLAEQRESRIANSAANTQLLRAINDQIDDLRKDLESDTGNASLKAALASAYKERDDVKKMLMGKSGESSAPSSQKPVDATRAKALID